jgi:4-alpha-glucanotransferase
MDLLHRAAQRFKAGANSELSSQFAAFCRESAGWLDDFALFMALKDTHGGAVWNTWHEAIVKRAPEAMAHWSQALADKVFAHKVLQFLFFRQWRAVKQYANEHDIRIIGDIPIFVAYDSADVWAHPDLFFLDDKGRPTDRRRRCAA